MLLPYYHIVSDVWVPHVSPLYRFRTVREFRNDLEWLLKHRQPTNLADFISSSTGSGVLPKNSFFLTFDDGFREMFDVVRPILLAMGIPAVFFATSATVDNNALCLHQKIAIILDQIGRTSPAVFSEVTKFLAARGVVGNTPSEAIQSITYSQEPLADETARLCEVDLTGYLRSAQPYLTSEQISVLLADGFGIGSHSIDHPPFSKIPFDEQIRQTRQSMHFFMDRFSLGYRLFAFPHSDASVSRRFFEELANDGTIQASFGTSAPKIDSMPRNFQRFSMEKTEHSARRIVALQSMRRLKQRLTGQSLINRL